jgi:hypothetical protein
LQYDILGKEKGMKRFILLAMCMGLMLPAIAKNDKPKGDKPKYKFKSVFVSETKEIKKLQEKLDGEQEKDQPNSKFVKTLEEKLEAKLKLLDQKVDRLVKKYNSRLDRLEKRREKYEKKNKKHALEKLEKEVDEINAYVEFLKKIPKDAIKKDDKKNKADAKEDKDDKKNKDKGKDKPENKEETKK